MTDADDLPDVAWCVADSAAQRWFAAHGYREAEYRRFHPGETQGWVKMVADELWDGEVL
jgi:hypothetical protein